MSDLSIEEYESVEDLETTIDHVHSSINRLDSEIDILLEETRRFLETGFLSGRFHSSSNYIETYLERIGIPGQVQLYAHKELDEPREAENWDELEEAMEKTTDMIDRFNIACKGLWRGAGYDEDELKERLGEQSGLSYFVEEWENSPHRLFQPVERYDGKHEFETVSGMHNPGPTMARYTGKSETRRQREDLERGKVLTWELRDTDLPNYDEKEDFWREKLYWSPGFSRWVDEEKLTD